MAMPVAALSFATWAVYTGGLASLQSDCDTNGAITHGLLNDSLPCSKAYRLPWFYMSWEIVVILLMVAAIASGKMNSMRSAFVGLFAVGTVLFIDVSNTMLDGQSNPYYQDGTPLHRIRTITAGAIMTALMNAIAIIVCGMTESEADKAMADNKTPV